MVSSVCNNCPRGTEAAESNQSGLVSLSSRMFFSPILLFWLTSHNNNNNNTPLIMSCPLTGEAIPDNALEVAVVYQVPAPYDFRKCECEMTLASLLDRCASTEDTFECPSCKKGLVVSVCDKTAAQSILQEKDCRSVALRFGTRNYFFAVSEEQLAQDRIQETLGDDVKILSSGKIVYPDESGKSAEEVSDLLLELSQKDIAGRKRPTLVVMGAKTGRWGAQGGHLHK